MWRKIETKFLKINYSCFIQMASDLVVSEFWSTVGFKICQLHFLRRAKFPPPQKKQNKNCPVSWSCRIHWLHLCREVRLCQECSEYDTKQSDGEATVLKLWGMWSTPSQSPAGFEPQVVPDLPPLIPILSRPLGHWPCVKSCLVGGRDK